MAKFRFFRPYIGEKYESGINGKKILVIGASFYCTNKSCQFFADCTDVVKKDSSKYDKICPDFPSEEQLLSEEPSQEIDNKCRTYKVFVNLSVNM